MKKYLLVMAFVCAKSFFCFIEAASSPEVVFTNIYDNGVWGRNSDGAGSSGSGSFPENCVEYITFLEKFIKDHNIKSVFDAGCGGWEFSRYINWSGINYLGCDVVASLIERNIKNFGSDNIKFVQGDFLTMELPSADLFICKQVFQHLRNIDIINFLSKLKQFKYCLITNDVDSKTLSAQNEDIKIGEYRWVDLSKPPFNVTGEKILNYVAHNWMHQVFLIDNTKG